MEICQRLYFSFKGSRDYLQGPDIYDETLSWVYANMGDAKEIDIAFHRLARHQLDLAIGDLPLGLEPVAVCSYTIADRLERIYLIESESPISERYPYPEEDIVRSMAVEAEARTCRLRGGGPYSDIEIWVAMTKALHQKVFLTLPGKWLFVRGRFSKYQRSHGAEDFEITIKACFNNKFTRSEVFVAGKKAGEIFFSIV
jgi:hypothetical protein